MKKHWKVAAAVTALAAGLAYVSTRSAPVASAADTFALAQDTDTALGAVGGPGEGKDGGMPRFIRAEAVVRMRDGDGFTTAKIDRGVIDKVDGTTVVVKEDDGTTVDIPTNDDTRIGRDGKKAKVSDLKAGDHVFTLRVKEGDGFVTKGVRAISPERFKQFEGRKGRFMQHHPRIANRMQNRRNGPGA